MELFFFSKKELLFPKKNYFTVQKNSSKIFVSNSVKKTEKTWNSSIFFGTIPWLFRTVLCFLGTVPCHFGTVACDFRTIPCFFGTVPCLFRTVQL